MKVRYIGAKDTLAFEKDKTYEPHYKKSRHKVKISEKNPPPLTRVNQMLTDRQRGRWRE